MSEAPDRRLDRIENKLDEIQKILVAMARIEERQSRFEEFTKNFMTSHNRLSERVGSIEKKVNNNSFFTDNASKVIWLVGAAVTGALIKWVVSNGMV